MILRSIFIVLSSIPLFSRAEFQTNLELLSFLSWTQTNQGSLSLIQYRNDASFYISGNFKYIRSGFTTEIRPEIRTLFSEGLDLDPSDTSYATIESHSRHFNWQQSLKKKLQTRDLHGH